MKQIRPDTVEYERDIEYRAAEYFEELLDSGFGIEAAALATEQAFPAIDDVQRRWLRG